MIEHRGVRRDEHRMRLREVGRAGRELDRLRVADERREKEHAVGDVLRSLREVFTHERVVEAELVRENDGLTVLVKSLRGTALQRMDRHREIAESHVSSPVRRAKPDSPVVMGTAMILSPHPTMIDSRKKLFVR